MNFGLRSVFRMKMNKALPACLMAIALILFYCVSVGAAEPDRMTEKATFDEHLKTFNDKSARLLLENLQQIVHYEHLPVSDGDFGDYVKRLKGLSPRKEHLPLIIKLIQKQDPYLQEAGVKLATASVDELNDFTGLEEPLCELLLKSDLDPWVLRSIIYFASVSNNSRSSALVKFYRTIAEVTYGRTHPDRNPEREKIRRNMGIDPYEDARALLDQVMLNSSTPTARTTAILPCLEKVYGTKGWASTYNAVESKVLKRGER